MQSSFLYRNALLLPFSPLGWYVSMSYLITASYIAYLGIFGYYSLVDCLNAFQFSLVRVKLLSSFNGFPFIYPNWRISLSSGDSFGSFPSLPIPYFRPPESLSYCGIEIRK